MRDTFSFYHFSFWCFDIRNRNADGNDFSSTKQTFREKEREREKEINKERERGEKNKKENAKKIEERSQKNKIQKMQNTNNLRNKSGKPLVLHQKWKQFELNKTIIAEIYAKHRRFNLTGFVYVMVI